MTRWGFSKILMVLWISASVACARGGSDANNGGVSDGGGGTTNPDPAHPEWIIRSAADYAGKMLTLWLNEQQAVYSRMDQEEKEKSGLRKVFEGKQDIFALIRETQVEMRMSKPCVDANGSPREGSIYSSVPGGICVSPFLMASKLTEMNYEVETAALIMHEISHLLGTTEEEARAIQKLVIYGLGHVDFLHTVVALDLLADETNSGRIPFLMMDLEMLADTYPQRDLRQSDLDSVFAAMVSLNDALAGNFFRYSFVRKLTSEAFRAEYVRLQVIRRAVCSFEPQIGPEAKKDCDDWLSKAFAGNTESTATDIMARAEPEFKLVGPEFDSVVIGMPTEKRIVSQEMYKLRLFLQKILDELRAEEALKFKIIRN